jgi:hypothetical protein
MKIGDRYMLRHNVDRYPHFVAKEGATGVLVVQKGCCIQLSMDEHIDGAEEWDNCICWYNYEEPVKTQFLRDCFAITSFRLPTNHELQDFLELMTYQQYQPLNVSREEINQLKEDIECGATTVVIDNYITDGPGYAGRLMMVVWGGSPEFHELYCWGRQGIKLVPQSRDLDYLNIGG